MLSSHVVLCCDQKLLLDAKIERMAVVIHYLKNQKIEPEEQTAIENCECELKSVKSEIECIERKFPWVSNRNIYANTNQPLPDIEDVGDFVIKIDSVENSVCTLETKINSILKKYPIQK